MLITVVIPTYRRPTDLLNCLQALNQQTRPADEVIIVIRDTDAETWEAIASNQSPLPLKTSTITVPGVVAAMNQGLNLAKGEIIAFTDDDAMPHPDWLERIQAHFSADPNIGGVGGRDYVYHGTALEQGEAAAVGQLSWFGRVTGNHHIGVGEARHVDVLKGVNMSFRRTAIANLYFDQRMRGTGAQVHFELAFCLALKRRGYQLIYDPQVAVDHFPAQRFDEDQRKSFNRVAVMNAAYNETVALLDHLRTGQRGVFLVWALLVGTQQSFGVVQWLRFCWKEGSLASQKLLTSISGRWQGWQSWQSWQQRQACDSQNGL